MNIAQVILSLPFKTRNADEFVDENILSLFVDPTDGVAGPFDYRNEIIKGKMGTGKTMYLRANYLLRQCTENVWFYQRWKSRRLFLHDR